MGGVGEVCGINYFTLQVLASPAILIKRVDEVDLIRGRSVTFALFFLFRFLDVAHSSQFFPSSCGGTAWT